MTETEQVHQVQQAFQLFLDNCAHGQITEEHVQKMTDFIFEQGLDPFKAGSYLRSYLWVQAEPQRLAKEEERREAEEERRRIARQEMLAPAENDRKRVIEEWRASQPKPKPVVVPDIPQAQMDRMTDKEIRAALGCPTIEDRQESGGVIVARVEYPWNKKSTKPTLRNLRKRGLL
jgi:hypothetical protein